MKCYKSARIIALKDTLCYLFGRDQKSRLNVCKNPEIDEAEIRDIGPRLTSRIYWRA